MAKNNETTKGLGIHARRAIAYVVLILLTIFCLIWFYILIINATRTNSQIQSGFSPLPGTNLANNWKNLMNSFIPVFAFIVTNI